MSSPLDEENSRLTEIINRTHIRFPWDLTLEQARELVKYICTKLPSRANYDFSQHVEVKYAFEDKLRGELPDGEEILKEEETETRFSGIIRHKIEPKAFDSFGFMPSKKDNSKLSSILFRIVDDWKITDYSPEVVQLWDDVRKIVDDYFVDNSNNQ